MVSPVASTLSGGMAGPGSGSQLPGKAKSSASLLLSQGSQLNPSEPRGSSGDILRLQGFCGSPTVTQQLAGQPGLGLSPISPTPQYWGWNPAVLYTELQS